MDSEREMNDETRHQLLKLSAGFYAKHAESFDNTRQRAWTAWNQLFETACDHTEIKTVLDIGCGNGRFAAFLQTKGVNVAYTGIDPETQFLGIARTRNPNAKFVEGDIETALETEKRFDFIVCFGVFHHLPGRRYRQELIRRFKERLTNRGMVAISFWQPQLLKNFDTKIINNPPTNDLEEGDFFMGWNGDQTQPRYCHHFDDYEIQMLVQQSSLDVLAHFQGSGNDASNRYVLLTKSTT